MQLVEIKDRQPKTSSYLVAKEFGIQHKHILEKLDGFTASISAVKFGEMYTETVRHVRGREFKTFDLNRDGYMFLVMNISTKKAHDKKIAFIDAFNAMERAILNSDENKNNQAWLAQRDISKEVRLEATDTIKDFIDYAISQGSKNSGRYYSNFTKTTYKALHLIQHNKPKLRDTLDGMDLAHLMVAENLATNKLIKYMGEGEHYKVIYQNVKRDLEEYSKVAGIPTVKALSK